MAPSLLDLLTPDLVTLDFAAANAADAIRATAAPLAGNPAVSDFNAFCSAVLAREEMSPTAAGHGVAFPHARGNYVSEIVVAAGRSRDGVPFGASGEQVHFVFIIGTPLDKVRDYLTLLSGLARLLKDSAVRERLLSASTPEALLKALRA
jgi:mannitol/fructose-specific phosphotransferase system IIA component (Ntr-type)